MLCHNLRRISGYICDRDSTFVRIIKIDIIHTGRCQADIFQKACPGQRLLIHRKLVYDDCIRLCDTLRYLLYRRLSINDDLTDLKKMIELHILAETVRF